MIGALVNGVPASTIALTDRGLHYGDGLFETLAVRDGEPEMWTRHMARLCHGATRLKLPPPATERLHDEARQLCRGIERGVLKLILTRGSGGRGYRPPDPAQPTRLLTMWPWPEYPEHWPREGVVVRWCQTRLGHSPALAGIKHLGRLEQVLARAEWDDPAIAEGLLLDSTGHVVEGSMSNLFWVEQGRLLTPLLEGCGVRGIQRERVIEVAQAMGVETVETRLSPERLCAADELFLTNRIIGLWPVRQLDAQHWKAPGPLTTRLLSALQSSAC